MTERGRAGKTHLQRRLATASHGAQLLDRKDRILGDELGRLQLREDRARADWERLARAATVWLLRAAALDGRAGIAAAGPTEPARATTTWGGSVGVTYPEDVVCDPPVAPPAGGSSALSFAAAAHREAVIAAVAYAGIRRAIALVQTELVATRIRRRAIEHRWIPRLTTQLDSIKRELDEQELEDILRMRWAGNLASHEQSRAPSQSRAPLRSRAPSQSHAPSEPGAAS